MAVVMGKGAEIETWHLPAKHRFPEGHPTGKVHFKLDGAQFDIAPGDEALIPSKWAYAVPMEAPQMKKGPHPDAPKAAKAGAQE